MAAIQRYRLIRKVERRIANRLSHIFILTAKGILLIDLLITEITPPSFPPNRPTVQKPKQPPP